MIVMTKCNICLNTEYKKVISLDDISDKLRYIGKDGDYEVYFGKHDDIYFVKNENEEAEDEQ